MKLIQETVHYLIRNAIKGTVIQWESYQRKGESLLTELKEERAKYAADNQLTSQPFLAVEVFGQFDHSNALDTIVLKQYGRMYIDLRDKDAL